MRRILSFLLAFAMAFSILPVQAFGKEAEPETRADTGDVTIRGINCFSNLLPWRLRKSVRQIRS